MQKSKSWIVFVMIHVIFMGVWGALIEIPEKNGFPATLGYVVWSVTMIPAALLALYKNKWQIDTRRKSIFLGSTTGLLGAIGQLVLFIALRYAPAYIVFPILSLTPVITIILSVLFLKEKTGRFGWIGITIAIIAIFLLSYQPGEQSNADGYLWLILVAIPLITWGTQGFIMRFSNESMKAESIFFYMMTSSILFAPVAFLMTDFSEPVNWHLNGMYLAAAVQILNAFGALCLVYAFRYGKAIIVAPMTTALSPVLTVLISLMIYAVIPHYLTTLGMIAAITSAILMGIEETRSEIK